MLHRFLKRSPVAFGYQAILLLASTTGMAFAQSQTWNLTTTGNALAPVTGTCITNPSGLENSLRLVQCTNTRGFEATDLHVFADYREPVVGSVPKYTARLDFDPISIQSGATFSPDNSINILFGRDILLAAESEGLKLNVYGYWTPAVPEPETYMLMLAGLVLLARRTAGSQRTDANHQAPLHANARIRVS